jgi:hypothetical protein
VWCRSDALAAIPSLNDVKFAAGDANATRLVLSLMPERDRRLPPDPAERSFDAADEMVIENLFARLRTPGAVPRHA